MTPLRWSVVIPAFNEARRLPPYLDDLVAYFDGRGDPYEVIVVDDGSTDGTGDVALARGRTCPAVRLIRLPENAGKGAAVRAGMLDATGAVRLFTDADGATPIAELKRFEPALAACVSRDEVGAEYIIPSVFNKAVAPAVAAGVARAAYDTGAARRRQSVDLSALR